MPKVMQTLHREHTSMAKLLNAFERQLVAFDQGDMPDYDVVSGVIDYCLTYPDLYHHPKEDLVFAKLQVRDPDAAEAVGDLRAEHEALGKATRRLGDMVDRVLNEGEVPRDEVQQTAGTFLSFYRRHIAMEEEQFFPAAKKALTQADWEEIEGQLSERHDPIFGREPEDRFAALRQDILEWEAEDEASPS